MKIDKEKLKEKGRGLLKAFDNLTKQATKFDIKSIEENTTKKSDKKKQKDTLKDLDEFAKGL